MTLKGAKKFLSAFFSVLGGVWLLIEVINHFFGNETIPRGIGIFSCIAIADALLSAYLVCPKTKISYTFKSIDQAIEIEVGDIFDSRSNIVVGINDTFDTEIGEIISKGSLQGILVHRIYSGDVRKFDAEVEASLSRLKKYAVEDPEKHKGKTLRYPIGSITHIHSAPKIFLSAYSRMDENCTASSGISEIQNSLLNIWSYFKKNGNGEELCMPIIGSELARSGLNRMLLIKLIILSFLAESKRGRITAKLKIVVYAPDLKLVDFENLEEFIKTIE